MSSAHYKVFNVDTNAVEDADLEFAWKEELASQGHATCIHSNCQLSFLSISGMVAHNKICPGFIRPSDFVPCMHCPARFKQYKSCQTHMERCHPEDEEPAPSANHHVDMERDASQTDRKNARDVQTSSNRFLVSESKPGPSAIVQSSARRPPGPSLPPTSNIVLPDVILPNRGSPAREPYSRPGSSLRTIPQGRVLSRRPSIASGNIIKARAADGRIHYFRAADPISSPQPGARARREPQRLVLVEDDIRHLLPQHPLPPQAFTERQALPPKPFTDPSSPAAIVHRARQRYSTTFKPEPSPPEPKPEVYISYGDHDYLPKSEFEESSRSSLVYASSPRFAPLKQEDSPASRKEKYLAEQEAKISELESMAAETEMLAKSRKEKELEERENKLRKWEMELQRREEEARRRLADAQMNLFDDSKTKIEKIDKIETHQRFVSSGHSGFSDLQNVILTREDLASLHPNDRPINSVVVGPREQDTWSDSSTRSHRTATAPSPSVSELTDPDSVTSSINASTNQINLRSLNSAASCYSDGEGSSPSFSPTHHAARRTSPVTLATTPSKSSVQIIPVSSKTSPKVSLPTASLQPADIIPISPIRSNTSLSSTPVASKGSQSFKITPTSSFQDIRPEPLPSPFNPRKPYESYNQIIKPVSTSTTSLSSITIIPCLANSFSTTATSATAFTSSSHSTFPTSSHSGFPSSSHSTSHSSSHPTSKTTCRFPLEFKDDSHQFRDSPVRAPPVKRAKVHYPTTQKRPIEVPKTFKLPASAIKLQNVPNPQIHSATQFITRRPDIPGPRSLSNAREYFHQASFSPDLSQSCESPLVRIPSFSPLEGGHFPTDDFLTPQPFDAPPPRNCTPNEAHSHDTSLQMKMAAAKSSENLFSPTQSELSDSIRPLESSQLISSTATQSNFHQSSPSQEASFAKEMQMSQNKELNPAQSLAMQEPRLSLTTNSSPPYDGEQNIATPQSITQNSRYSTDIQDCPVNLSKNKSPTQVVENIVTNVAAKNMTTSVETHKIYTAQNLESNTENVINEVNYEKESTLTKAPDTEVVVALGEEFNLDSNLVVNDGVKLESLLEQAAGGMLTLVADPSAQGQFLIVENSNTGESGKQACPFIDASKGVDIAAQGIDVLVKRDPQSEARKETNNCNLKVEKEATPERNQSCDVVELEIELEALKSTYKKSLEENGESLLESNSSQQDISPTKDLSRQIESFSNQEKDETFRIFRSKNDECKTRENNACNSSFSIASDSESSSKVDSVHLKQGNVKHKKNSKKDSLKSGNDLNLRNRTTSFTDIAQGTFEDLEREIAKEVPEPSGDIVDYLEKRLKEFECDFTNITSMEEDNAGTQSSQAADMESEPDSSRTTRKSHRIKRRSSKLLANVETASESEVEHQVPQARGGRQEKNKAVENSPKEVGLEKSNQNKAELKASVDEVENVTESLTNVKLSKRLKEKKKRKNKVPPREKEDEVLDQSKAEDKSVAPAKINTRRSSRGIKSTNTKIEEVEVTHVPSRRSARLSSSSLKQKQDQSDCEQESSKTIPNSTKRKIDSEISKPSKRPRKESSENDEALSIRKMARSNQDTKTTKSKPSLACGKCDQILTSNRGFQTHVATEHGGCARLKDDALGQEFTTEQETQAWQEAFNLSSSVTCPRCSTASFTSKYGMKNHVQTCNRTEAEIEAIKVDCPEPDCVQRLLPQHVKSHETKHRNERRQLLLQQSVPSDVSQINTESPGSRGKRQAAQKARKLFTELVQQMRQKLDDGFPEDDNDGDVSDDGDDENYDVYEELSVATLFRSVRDASGAKVVRCTVCTSEFDTKANVEAHIMAEHSTELLDDQGDDTGEDWSDGSEDEDELRGSIHSHRPRRSTGGGPCSVRQRRLEPFSECVTTEAEYRRDNYFHNEFPDLSVVARDWKPLNQEKAATFLPAASTSAKFTVRQARAKSPAITEEEREIRMLERFSGGYINSCPMMFTGGPVWAMAWCPLPNNHHEPSDQPESDSNTDIPDQYLAVSSQLHMDSESPLQKTSGGPGLVQIWKCPGLDLKDGSAPLFSFGLAHHYGSVWCLEWCPSGMFDSPDTGSRPSDVMRRRLGGLAAACGDGTVRIFTLPHPDNLQEGQVYLREADLTLQADQGGADLHGQCIKLSWYRGRGHNWIAASFSSGVVGLWHITTTSPLLKNTQFILPTQAWLAHTSSVTGLSLSPYGGEDPRHLLTGSTDRCYKFWDLRDTAVPLQVVKRGMVTSVSWLPGWAAGTVSHDDVYLQSHTQTLVTESGYYTSRSQPVIAQNSGVWDESVSSWTGSLAAGTSAGELIVFVLPSLDRSMEHDKICNQRRTYVYRTEVETEELPQNTDHQLYQTAKDFSTLGFVDIPLLSGGAGDCPTDEMRKVRSADRMGAENLVVYPLPSVNRVRWNNNLGAHLWLASGGQAGLVRIHNVRGLQSGEVRKAIQAIDHNV